MRLVGKPLTRAQHRLLGITAGMVVVVGAAAAFFITRNSPPAYQPRSLPVSAPSVTPSLQANPSASSGVTPQVLARSVPVEVKIPAIGVDARIMQVYDPGGVLGTPPLTGSGAQEVGWWAGLPSNPQQSHSPGQAGPAVLVGHINSAAAGDLVFAHLSSLKRGDTVTVILADGKSVAFTMQFLQETPKNAFPTNAVYGQTADPELRLITCGGAFDPSTGHYKDNLIAYLTETVS